MTWGPPLQWVQSQFWALDGWIHLRWCASWWLQCEPRMYQRQLWLSFWSQSERVPVEEGRPLLYSEVWTRGQCQSYKWDQTHIPTRERKERFWPCKNRNLTKIKSCYQMNILNYWLWQRKLVKIIFSKLYLDLRMIFSREITSQVSFNQRDYRNELCSFHTWIIS